jgi:excisionase family DNA binding protein
MERLLNVEDVARLLGISRFTVYAWAADRRLPALKVGSRLMFRPFEIQQWIDRRPRPEGDETPAGDPMRASS